MSLGLRYMFVAAFFFSVMSVLVKFAGAAMPSQQLVLARNAFAIVFTFWLIKRARLHPWGNNKRLLVVRGFLGFGALTCFYYAITHLPLADATVIQFMNPVWTALFAAMLIGERVGAREVLASVISLTGVVIMVQPSFLFGGESLPTVGVVVALCGSLLSGLAYVTVRELRKTDDPLVVVFYFPLIALPLSIPTAAPSLVLPHGWQWLLLLAIGLTTQIGQVFMTKSLHVERAARAATVSYVQIIFAFLWGWWLFGEQPAPLSIVGTALILTGMIIVTTAPQRTSTQDSH